MSEIKRLKRFLQENCPNAKTYNTNQIIGDFMLRIYDCDGIIVNQSQNNNYIVIYGLTDEEFEDLTENGFLKTFEIRRNK